MLLDEITSALDPDLVGDLLVVLRQSRIKGMTMVLARHQMGFARDFADTTGFLDPGRILEQGRPSSLTALRNRKDRGPSSHSCIDPTRPTHRLRSPPRRRSGIPWSGFPSLT